MCMCLLKTPAGPILHPQTREHTCHIQCTLHLYSLSMHITLSHTEFVPLLHQPLDLSSSTGWSVLKDCRADKGVCDYGGTATTRKSHKVTKCCQLNFIYNFIILCYNTSAQTKKKYFEYVLHNGHTDRSNS